MSVAIVGSGPAAAAVEAALGDVDAEPSRRELGKLDDASLAVVVGQAGDTVFERANERALESGLRWVSVELGGVGGFPVTDAAVGLFGPDTGCYECLSGRVSASLDPQADPAAAPPSHTARFAGAVAGRQAARYVTDGDAAFGTIVEIPYDTREFLPLPNCACGDPRSRAVEDSALERDLEASLAHAERAVDERLGIVQNVGEAESFPVPYYLAHSCDTTGFSDASAGRDTAGVAAGWDAAFMKALGEALERYCAGIYRAGEFETGTAEELPDTVALSAFVSATDPGPDQEIQWVQGKNLATGGEVYLPAEFVHYPPPSREFRPPVTTGLGLGNGGVGAILAGLFEVIERDATMLSWYSTFEPLALSITEPGYETLVDRARSEGLTVTPLLVTQDVDVPAVAVAVHREEWPAFALGSGAHLDVARAARSALGEALQNWMELRGMGPDEAAEESTAIGRYADFPEAAREFLNAGGPIPAAEVGDGATGSGAEELEATVGAVSEAGLVPHVAVLTPRDVERIGLSAVRVALPGAQPLFTDRPAFGERAGAVPADLGFEPRTDRDHHPYP